MTPVTQFDYLDERTVRGADGEQYDVLEAIRKLPWVRQLCPFMPHEYAILSKSPGQAWYVVEAMIRLSPNAYRAFFRGYQSPNRYWEALDGRRYWRGRFEIDRWDASDTTGLRRRDEDAHAIKDWDGPPWAPNGTGYYVANANGKWWPSAKFFAEGYEACRACRNPPRTSPRDRDCDAAIRTGIYGLLIGDALGVPYEFTSADDIGDVVWARPTHRAKSGTWSDDGSPPPAQFDSVCSGLRHR